MEKMQSTFQCTIEQNHITVRSNLGPTFQKQNLSVLLEGQLVDHTEVDCDKLFEDMPGLQEILPEPEDDSDGEEDANDPKYKQMTLKTYMLMVLTLTGILKDHSYHLMNH